MRKPAIAPEAKPLAYARGSAAASGAAGVQRMALDDRVVIEMEARPKEWAGQQQPNPAAKQRQNEPERRK